MKILPPRGCARRRVSERNRRRRLLARRLKVAPQGRMRGKPFNTAILISVYPRFGGVFVLGHYLGLQRWKLGWDGYLIGAAQGLIVAKHRLMIQITS